MPSNSTGPSTRNTTAQHTARLGATPPRPDRDPPTANDADDRRRTPEEPTCTPQRVTVAASSPQPSRSAQSPAREPGQQPPAPGTTPATSPSTCTTNRRQ